MAFTRFLFLRRSPQSLTTSLRYRLCCRHRSLLTCKISNTYFKRKKKKHRKNLPPLATTRLTQWDWYPLVQRSPRQGGDASTSPGCQAQASPFQIPCLSPLQGAHPALHSGSFRPSWGNKVIVIMIASKRRSRGRAASGCGCLDETGCDAQEIHNSLAAAQQAAASPVMNELAIPDRAQKKKIIQSLVYL